jgi:hypothetical protein
MPVKFLELAGHAPRALQLEATQLARKVVARERLRRRLSCRRRRRRR